jgi:hypothetical protein
MGTLGAVILFFDNFSRIYPCGCSRLGQARAMQEEDESKPQIRTKLTIG